MLFKWRQAIISKHGPKSPSTRLVLLTLSVHMQTDGSSCFPSTKRLAMETGFSERTVCTHLEIAEKEGWIQKMQRAIYNDRRWKHHCYIPLIPTKALKEVQHLSTQGTEPHAQGTEPDDNKALKEVQSNSSYINSTNNTPIYRYSKEVELPSNFYLTDEMKTYAKQKGFDIDLDAFTDNFILKCQAHGYKYKDWIAAWKNWLRKEIENDSNRPGKTTSFRKSGTAGTGSTKYARLGTVLSTSE